MTKELRFKNIKNIPDVDGTVPRRISLKVNSEGIPINAYWKRRFNEGALEVIKGDETPKSEPKTTEPKEKEPVVSKPKPKESEGK